MFDLTNIEVEVCSETGNFRYRAKFDSSIHTRETYNANWQHIPRNENTLLIAILFNKIESLESALNAADIEWN